MAFHLRSRAVWSASIAATMGVLLSPGGARVLVAQGQGGAPQRPAAVFRSSVDLVTVNVVVRDKSGAIVRGLTRGDFVVTEDGARQGIDTFDFEEVTTEAMETAPTAVTTVLGSVGRAPAAASAAAPAKPTIDMHGHRLIAMLFDLSSMQPEEIKRSADSARDYIQKKLTPADMVAIATLSTTLQVPLDFTADRDQMLHALDVMTGSEGSGFEELTAGDPTDDSATAFTADDSEFTLFNTDRRLQAIQALTEAMAPIEQKKSLIYFSSGMTQTGLDNRVAMRTVVDKAVKSNVSIYAADMRGLQALGPAGDASQASTRGQSAFSGAAVSGRFDSMSSSQDALSSLAQDTGGRAFFDLNDFGTVFDKVVADTSAYYLLGFSSTNHSKDGRFRRIRVTLKRPDLKLEYRAGYYAPRDFAHAGRDDREQQLTEQLFSDLSVTDVPVYASSAYFRIKGDRYFVPVWIMVPGSSVPFNKSGDKSKATIDIVGVVRDPQQRPVARIRDTVNLAVSATDQVERKNVQYQTDLELPPGVFTMKVVVRENETGSMGSFEAAITVPNLARNPIKVSSVIVGSRLQSGIKKDPRNPLLQNGTELIPSVAHVVTAGQPLYLYYELYDATITSPEGGNETKAAAAAGQGIKVVSNVLFFRGQQRVLETSLVEVTAVSSPDRKATTFQLEVPTTDLKPGLYTCQVNIVDDVAGTFAFPRLAIYVKK
jgi:VWFA-related protein